MNPTLVAITAALETYDNDSITRLYPMLSDNEVKKIQVLNVLQTSRAAYEDMHVFENAVLVLNGIDADVTKIEGCEPKHIWKALIIIKNMHPDVELSHEIKMYIKYIFSDYGYNFYPPNFSLGKEDMLKDLESAALGAQTGPELDDNSAFDIQLTRYLLIKEYLTRSNI
jgi:hypothetical protein